MSDFKSNLWNSLFSVYKDNMLHLFANDMIINNEGYR